MLPSVEAWLAIALSAAQHSMLGRHRNHPRPSLERIWAEKRGHCHCSPAQKEIMTENTLAGATPENVAAHSTIPDVLDRSAINLLGIYGPKNSLRALVRLPSGRIQKVEAGKRFGLGRIVGIDADGLMVLKNGQTRRVEISGS
jgi:hypothetical protein